MSPLVLGLEWEVAWTRKRRIALNTAVPLAVVVPLATGAVQPTQATGAYVLLFVLFSMYTSGTSLLRDGASGLASRVFRSGIAPWSYLLQRALAGSLMDILELTPAVLVVAVAMDASAGELGWVYLGLAAAVWIGNHLGLLIASVSRSAREVGLLASTLGALLFHMSGVFRMPAPGSVGASLESASPFQALHEALLATTTGATGSGWIGAALWSVGLPAVVAALGALLVRPSGEPGAGEVARA